MVTLEFPGEFTDKFFYFMNCFYGPMDGNMQFTRSKIPLELSTRGIEERKGIHGENHVTHWECDGVVEYYPVLADCIPFPSPGLMRQIKVPIIRDGISRLATIPYGFAISGQSYLCNLVGSTYYEHWAWLRETDDRWYAVQAYASQSDPFSLQMWKEYRFTLKSWATTQDINVEVYSNYPAYTGGARLPFSMDRDCSYEQIAKECRAAIRCSTWWQKTQVQKLAVYKTNPSYIRSPHDLANDVNVFVDRLAGGKFPIDKIDYGDLAMQALEKKRAITNNMLEFLSDLKHCKDLVPKLKSLRSLKGLSGQYLSIKYGILPTISDLESIVAAFRKQRPYFDKNGFATYSAGHLQQGWINGNEIFASLEQHIKVAVAEEDNDFEMLLEQLDNLGLLPTLENVWDLTKYSFVVDWFVNVGGFLERIDYIGRILRYNIRYATLSVKKGLSGYMTGRPPFPLVGSVYWRYYHRWVQAQCPLPPLTLKLSPTPTNHWLEGTALLVQRL